jgi:hypothetical protein
MQLCPVIFEILKYLLFGLKIAFRVIMDAADYPK